jgi:hypothetical protein
MEKFTDLDPEYNTESNYFTTSYVARPFFLAKHVILSYLPGPKSHLFMQPPGSYWFDLYFVVLIQHLSPYWIDPTFTAVDWTPVFCYWTGHFSCWLGIRRLLIQPTFLIVTLLNHTFLYAPVIELAPIYFIHDLGSTLICSHAGHWLNTTFLVSLFMKPT